MVRPAIEGPGVSAGASGVDDVTRNVWNEHGTNCAEGKYLFGDSIPTGSRIFGINLHKWSVSQGQNISPTANLEGCNVCVGRVPEYDRWRFR